MAGITKIQKWLDSQLSVFAKKYNVPAAAYVDALLLELERVNPITHWLG